MKERVIGAVVLVLVAVLVVPIFLDGPPDDQEVVRTSVTLPGQNPDNRQQQTIVLNRDRSQPVPATQGQETAAPAVVAERAPEVVEPRTEAPAVADAEIVTESPAATESSGVAAELTVPAATESETGMWAVQLGSFSNQENAERLAADLRGQGYAAFLSQLQRNDTALHRVRVGPQKDRESAEAIAAQLGKGGHSGQVVPHP